MLSNVPNAKPATIIKPTDSKKVTRKMVKISPNKIRKIFFTKIHLPIY